MANMKAKNADGAVIYLAATGAGSDGDPLVPRSQEANSAAILAAASAARPVTDGGGSLTVDIASAAWTQFYGAYTASDTGEVTPIAAPGAGFKLQFCELVAVSGQAVTNTLIIKNGATPIKAVPTINPMEGYMRVCTYPDYLTLADNAALNVSHSANAIWWCYGSYRVVAA